MKYKRAIYLAFNHPTTSMPHFCGLFNYASYCYGYSTLEQQRDQITIQYNKSESVSQRWRENVKSDTK